MEINQFTFKALVQAVESNTKILERIQKQLSIDVTEDDPNVTVNQFMKRYNVSRSTVERHKKKLGFFKFNGKLYIKQSRILALEREGGILSQL